MATIVASPRTEDDEAAEARQRDAEALVARAIADAAGTFNETLDLRGANGRVHLWLAGSHNHRDETVTGLFRSIAQAAPGSYGVMYVLDSDASYTWERWVMRRGTVSREVDTSLSPHIGVVEDPAWCADRKPLPVWCARPRWLSAGQVVCQHGSVRCAGLVLSPGVPS